MKYESTARPILTLEDLKAAQNAGALIQFTAYGPGSDWGRGDAYDMPPHGRGSGGWIGAAGLSAGDLRDIVKAPDRGELLRAWYPLANDKEVAE